MNKTWTIPNIISLYRILIFPFIIYLVLSRQENLAGIFIAISLFTDWLDGIIARTFKMETAMGAKLDSWADIGTYICAIMAIYIFKWNDIKPYIFSWYAFLILWLLAYIIVFIKFGGIIGLHTYLFKATGYAQGAFIVVLFLWGFYRWLFFISLTIGIIACIEEIIIIMMLKKPQMNVKGLYWLVKNKMV